MASASSDTAQRIILKALVDEFPGIDPSAVDVFARNNANATSKKLTTALDGFIQKMSVVLPEVPQIPPKGWKVWLSNWSK